MATPSKKIGYIRVRSNQIKVLVDAMEKNPLLNGNNISSNYTAGKRNEDWEELAKKLNNTGGAIKSVRCWQKCWTDKKGEVKKRNHLLKAGKLKTDGSDEDRKLTPLEERIVRLIEQGPVNDVTVEESEIMHNEFLIPKVEVEECPTSLSSPVIATVLPDSQPFTQESNSDEVLLPDAPSRTEESHQPESPPQIQNSQMTNPFVRLQSLILSDKTKPIVLKLDSAQTLAATQESNQTDSPEHLPDTPSQLSHTEEYHQPESVTPQFATSQSRTPQGRLQSSRKRVRTKPVVLKSDNAQKLVDGQIAMASALTRCADALERHNYIQERLLEIKKRKSDAQERALAIENRKADARERTLEMEERKVDAQERALEIEKRKAEAQERVLEIKKHKADAFVQILSTLKNKF